jgi:CheY-like chemotaxis protein
LLIFSWFFDETPKYFKFNQLSLHPPFGTKNENGNWQGALFGPVITYMNGEIGNLPMTNKVLVVDDQPDQQEIVRLLLNHMGYEVTCAKDAEDAWEIAQEIMPDIFLIDLTLPGRDGLSLCADLREEPHLSHIPRIILSGVDKQDIEREDLSTYADEYITKPFDIQILAGRVQELINKKRAFSDIQELVHS